MYILYLTFMAEIIMFKAILIHFPITFLNLNTSKIKFTCVLIGFLHYVIAIGVVVADIYTENCGFINSLDMDEAYDLIDRTQMVQFTKYKHVFQWGFIGIVFPISWCYEMLSISYYSFQKILKKITRHRVVPACSVTVNDIENNHETTVTNGNTEHAVAQNIRKLKNIPDSHSIALFITLTNIIIMALSIVRNFVQYTYPFTVVIYVLGRLVVIIVPICWFYNYTAAVTFAANRLHQLKASFSY